MIINHTNEAYIHRWQYSGDNKYNGAYYYSIEICRNIIPRVVTDRNWITVNIPVKNHVPQFTACGADHSIVFIHNNLNPENYDWLKKYNDLILICGIPETCEKVAHLGKAVYLPLSIDVQDVKRHKKPKTKDVAFVGRKPKRGEIDFPPGTAFVENLPRELLLSEMARYRKVYAVGRTAIEAVALDCEILPYDPRFPDASRWKVFDNKDAAKQLQQIIDNIDA